jgi:cytochrome c peroxidase
LARGNPFRGTWWLALVVLLAACPKGGDKPKPVEPVKHDDALGRLLPVEDAGVTTLSPAPPLPALPAGLPALPANPRVTPEAVAFGELLFHDGRLAASGARSCVSCHDPATGYAGPVQRAADEKPNLRRTPTLVNLAWSRAFGWDGRYASFAAHLPAHLKGQLGDSLETVTARIAEVPVYKLHLARVGGAPQDAIVQALEAYSLTRYEGDSAWDRMERTALTKAGTAAADPIVAGYQLFMGKAQCGMCHVPPLYTDHGFHRVTTNPFRDPGNKDAKGGFKTPTLRGVSGRRAFFHSGSQTTLDDAVLQYATPPADADPIVAKIKLTPDEAKQLVAFLNALTADRPAPTKPVLP